jgi:hypothetical protein
MLMGYAACLQTLKSSKMDYGFSEKRKNKNDKKAKSKYNLYKKGGKYRSTNITGSNNAENKNIIK